MQPFLVFENIERMPRRKLFTLLGVEWYALPTAWIEPVLFIITGIVLAMVLFPDESLITKLLIGVIYGVLAVVVNLLHTVGHILSARWVGAPMQANLLAALRHVNLYDDPDPDALPSRVHVIRSLGGPLMNIGVGLVSLIAYALAGGHMLLFFAAVNLIYGALAASPLPSFDGTVFLREWKKKQAQVTLNQVIPGLYMTQRAANIYLLDDADRGVTVIDTGMPGATSGILKIVAALGYQPSDVRHILVTHSDVDHVGSLGGLAKVTGAKVYAGESTAGYIRSHSSPPHVPAVAQFFGGLVQKWVQKDAEVHQIVTDGEVLPIAGGIRVIAAPGHSRDNVNFFWERERVLFAADLLNRMSGQLAFSPEAVTEDMEQVKRSTRKVLALNPAVICVGHGDPFFVRDAPGEVDALLRETER